MDDQHEHTPQGWGGGAGDRDPLDAPDGGPARHLPPPRAVTRYPQPPPPTWDDGDEGPGSPRGSVRPPDVTGTVEPPPTRRRARGLVAVALAALVGGAIGTMGTLAAVDSDAGTSAAAPADGDAGSGEAGGGETEGARTRTAPTIDVAEAPTVIAAVAQAVLPSVVRVDILEQPGCESDATSAGNGSGVIYRSDGYVITNNHVVENANGICVVLSSGDRLDAEVVGSDPLSDLAVLSVDRPDLPAINLRSDDDEVQVGETAVAIGSPFGLDASVTAGIVSATNRPIQLGGEQPLSIPNVVQTDAAINPGNSGGALVDGQGRLIGINTLILTSSGANQGVGFAVPTSQAVASADDLIEKGEVDYAFLGIEGENLTGQVAREFGIPVDGGAIVVNVEPGTAADGAGLQSQDIITAVDGSAVTSMSKLAAIIRSLDPGDEITLTILRDGEEQRVDVTLGERPAS